MGQNARLRIELELNLESYTTKIAALLKKHIRQAA
jgi:hypothetical protein